MRNPPRTQQNSIFEPLFSHEQEELRTPPTHLIHFSSASEWLSSTYSASPCGDKAYRNNQLRKAPTCTILNEEMSTNQRKCAELLSEPECEPVSWDHRKPSTSSTDVLGRSMQSAPAPSRSLSSGNIDKDDDGSVASKLLASITKSLSSPSLLSCCKESARETPYQKTLKLRMMKLQHCAEELGSESSDAALIYSNGGVHSTFDGFSNMSSFESSSRLSTTSSFARPLPYSTIPQNDRRGECDASPMMISVRSAPNLRCPSLGSRHNSLHVRERSFPPPLSHTLTRSASADSFTFSLRAHREDGRFMLKEVKAPSRQYLLANRKGGRLTLQLFTSADEDIEQEDYVHKELEGAMDVQQDEIVAGMCEGVLSAASDKDDVVGCSYRDKPALESATMDDVGGDAEVIELKEGIEIDDDVNMDEVEEKISKEANSDVGKDGGLSAKSLLMATINVDGDGKAYDGSDFGASGMKRPDFNGTECGSEKWLLASTSRSDLTTRLLGDIPRLKVMSPLIRLAQCEEDMASLQSKSNRKISNMKGRKCMLGVEISSTASLQGAGFDIDRSLLSSTIIFKDVDTSFLIGSVTKLVNSFGLDGGKWCQRKLKSRDQLERSGFKSGHLKDSSMGYNGITSINIGVRKVDRKGPHKANHGVNKKVADTHKAIGVRILNVECESEAPRTDAFAKEGGGIMDMNARGLSSTKPTTLHFDVLLPLHLDWLQNLHCKELSQRSHFANKGFPYVAIRS